MATLISILAKKLRPSFLKILGLCLWGLALGSSHSWAQSFTIGDPVYYTVTFTNSTDPVWSGVTVSTLLPSDFAFVTCGPVPCSDNSGTIVWNVGTVPQFQPVTLFYQAVVASCANTSGTEYAVVSPSSPATSFNTNIIGYSVNCLTDTPTPAGTPTASFTPTSTKTPTLSPTITNTFTVTNTPTPSGTPTASFSPTPTKTPTLTRTPTDSPTVTNTPTITNTLTDTYTKTATNSPTATKTPTVTLTPTNSPTVTLTPTVTNTKTSTNTLTPTFTKTTTKTPTQTLTFTQTLTPTQTRTPTQTPTITNTPTVTLTATITNTPTITPTPGPETFYISLNKIDSASGPASIYMSYPTVGVHGAKIYNSAGEFITNLYDQGTDPNGVAHSYVWDGTNYLHQKCASGVYILYAVEPLRIREAKILLLR